MEIAFGACVRQVNGTAEETVATRRLPRDFAEQLRIDEYTQQLQQQTLTTTTSTEYRPVALDNIPVPSCGGNLTGKTLSHVQYTFIRRRRRNRRTYAVIA